MLLIPVVMVVLAAAYGLVLRYGADSRPDVNDPPEPWIGTAPDERVTP